MSVRIMSAVFESETLGPTERLILLSLADHADDEGRCYPSISRLCKRTGLAERTVQSNLRKLEQAGYVTVVHGKGRAGSNLYLVAATPAADAPPQQMHPAADAPQTPQQMHPTPAADAPKPSRTIIEPSDYPAGAKPVEILETVVSGPMAKSFIDLRAKMKKPVNELAARRIVASLQSIAAQGGDPEDALGLCQEKGWQSIKPEWYFKDKANECRTPRPSRSTAQSDALRQQLAFAGTARRPSRPDCF